MLLGGGGELVELVAQWRDECLVTLDCLGDLRAEFGDGLFVTCDSVVELGLEGVDVMLALGSSGDGVGLSGFSLGGEAVALLFQRGDVGGLLLGCGGELVELQFEGGEQRLVASDGLVELGAEGADVMLGLDAGSGDIGTGRFGLGREAGALFLKDVYITFLLVDRSI